MADFPVAEQIPNVISITSPESDVRPMAVGTFASGIWPAANRAFFYPFILPRSMPIRQLYVVSGAAQSGNLNMGLYDGALKLLIEKGSTSHTANNAVQFLDITDTAVGPGLVYLALVCSNTTSQFFRVAASAALLRSVGAFQQDLANVSLPSTATPAAIASAFCPWVGMVSGRML